jgi:hypothetical protein
MGVVGFVIAAILGGCDAREDPATSTVESGLTSTFQAGVNNYRGTIDGSIARVFGAMSSTDLGAQTAWIARYTAMPLESEALVKFTNLSLPPGAVITRASLTLTFRDFVGGHRLRGHYVMNSWSPAFVGWFRRDSGASWSLPGAKRSGVDISATPAFVDNSWNGSGTVRRTYALDAATVQGWITTPATNLGIVLFNNEVANRLLVLQTAEASTRANRPLLTIEYTLADTQLPTVAITAPAGGTSYHWNTNVGITATASDNVGVAGVQFLLDGQPLGAEDVTAPYEAVYNTGFVNATRTLTARARDAAGNVKLSNPVTITVNDSPGVASHPRIWMDASSLSLLRQRAAANDARWLALRSQCNTYLGGIVQPPNPVRCEDSCSGSTICCGYQGDTYYRALVEVALCYQVGKGLSPPDPSTSAWAAKGSSILAQMVTFTNYSTDHGYGIRFFAPAMAIGYDWLHEHLAATDPALTATVVTRLNEWIDWYDAQPASFNFREHPTSNYFAGYYAAKALTALATDGENPNATTYWNGFLEMQRSTLGSHLGIAPYYTKFLNGGGWVQGWQYGPLAVRNMIEPSLAALTAKGVDLINDPNAPYQYALNSALHLMHFSTPSLTMMDDRSSLSSFNPADPGVCPSQSKVPIQTALTLVEMLRRWPLLSPSGDPVAPRFHSFARRVRSIYAPLAWQDMLYWDDAAPEAPYTATPDRSYLATNYVSLRSDWSTSATMATMRAIAFSDKDNTHQHADGGSLIITRGNGGPAGDWTTDVPFLVSPNFLLRCYGTTPISGTWENDLRTDLTATSGARATVNTFRNSTTSGQSILIYQDDPVPPRTGIRTFEDRGGFAFARAENLEDLYPATSGITEWSRDVVFVRPNRFVVYDRTTSGGTGADPHLSWHFAPTPVLAAPPSPGAVRYDVADGTVFKGAMTTLLPVAASVTAENVYGSNKLFALRVRGPASGRIGWLTVFDTATSAGAVALASRIETPNANGALLASTAGDRNTVVLFGLGAAGSPIAGPISYAQPAAETAVIIADLAPNTTYAVTATVNGANHEVTIAPASVGFTTSARGTLYVTIAATGTVSAGT